MFSVIVPRVYTPEVSHFNMVENRFPWAVTDRDMAQIVAGFYNDKWNFEDDHERCCAGAGIMERIMEDMCEGCQCDSPCHSKEDTTDAKDTCEQSNFEMKLDVSGFHPDDLSVQVNGRHLEITARHQEREDECGYVSKEFRRKVLLPKNVDADSLESVLTKDGQLLVKANVKAIITENPKQIEVQRGQSSTNDSHNETETSEREEQMEEPRDNNRVNNDGNKDNESIQEKDISMD